MDKIVVNVEYTKKVIQDLNRNHFKYGTRITTLIINICFCFDILANLFLIILGEYNVELLLGLGILLVIFVLSNTNIFADISTFMFLRTDKLSLGLKSEMTFEKDKITVVNETENMNLSYDKLYKIIETKEYIYLYLNKVQALIVVKENNTDNELDALRNILKENVKKYIEFIK